MCRASHDGDRGVLSFTYGASTIKGSGGSVRNPKAKFSLGAAGQWHMKKSEGRKTQGEFRPDSSIPLLAVPVKMLWRSDGAVTEAKFSLRGV